MNRMEHEEKWLKCVMLTVMDHRQGMPGRKVSGAGCFSLHRAQTERTSSRSRMESICKESEKITAAAAPSTAEVEDGKHTSRSVLIAVEKKASVVVTTGGKVKSVEENEGTIVQMWVN